MGVFQTDLELFAFLLNFVYIFWFVNILSLSLPFIQLTFVLTKLPPLIALFSFFVLDSTSRDMTFEESYLFN